jgi:hypothetical protein
MQLAAEKRPSSQDDSLSMPGIPECGFNSADQPFFQEDFTTSADAQTGFPAFQAPIHASR